MSEQNAVQLMLFELEGDTCSLPVDSSSWESCEECPYYDAMNGECLLLDFEGELCPIVSGKASPEDADGLV